MTIGQCPATSDRHGEDRVVEIDARAQAEIQRAVDAVCAELGLDISRETKRERIASGIASTWRDGRRLPLNLVNAGFDAVCC